ncbi:GNAT family N-acetyltransferase [Alkalimarinus coralli]|uniref:GNAT family N-acetyltransferase n=1 Tax=Alkalimarinus coralli TaxID=2935863 RepID=UPI00202B5640|nr:GNAT family N-acetyltransferase [Alkalimarinus coralli]
MFGHLIDLRQDLSPIFWVCAIQEPDWARYQGKPRGAEKAPRQRYCENRSMLKTTYEQLAPVAYPLVNRFYKQAREKGKTQGSDEVYVARVESEIIAAVRICPVHEGGQSTGTTPKKLLLRSLAVLPDYRRTGVGSQFMDYVVTQLGARECWCYPFSWLQGFYEQSGFEFVAPEYAPESIRGPFENYRRQGRDILIMVRRAVVADD